MTLGSESLAPGPKLRISTESIQVKTRGRGNNCFVVDFNRLLLIVKLWLRFPGERKSKVSKSPGPLETKCVTGLCLALTSRVIPRLKGVLPPIKHLHDIMVLNQSGAC